MVDESFSIDALRAERALVAEWEETERIASRHTTRGEAFSSVRTAYEKPCSLACAQVFLVTHSSPFEAGGFHG